MTTVKPADLTGYVEIVPENNHNNIRVTEWVYSLKVPVDVEARIKTHSKWAGPGTASLEFAGGDFETNCTTCKGRRRFHWHFRGQLSLCSECHQPHPTSRRQCWGCDEVFYAFEHPGRNPKNLYCTECEPTS